jgi:16S rRNA processing protein RimM
MGRIGAPFGVKGWVKLFSFTDPADNLLDYHRFWVVVANESADGLQSLEFDEIKVHGKDFVGHIKDCDVREQACRYTGQELLIAKTELPALDAGFYWYQLEGLRVVTTSGQDLGKVQHLLETGANDVLVVKGDAHSVDQSERLVPYIKDSVIKQVDLKQATILVEWDKDY